MVFKRVLHDGLSGVILRGGMQKITFVRGLFETDDQEQCQYLIKEGYAYDGEKADFLVHQSETSETVEQEEPVKKEPPQKQRKDKKARNRNVRN